MKILENIPYSGTAGDRGVGDLFLPENLSPQTPLALSIHGGGWVALDKSRMAGIAEFLCTELGFAVFSINYRLAGDTPWPACGDDCLAGARFLLEGDIPEIRMIRREKILVIGGSAGGHLALMTGLRLPPEKVSGIISISGINSMKEDFELVPERYTALYGHVPTERELRAVDPVAYLTPASPPVLCTHDTQDNVVTCRCTAAFAAAAKANGSSCSCYFYCKDETGFSHRIFIPGSIKLYRDIEENIAAWLQKGNCPAKS